MHKHTRRPITEKKEHGAPWKRLRIAAILAVIFHLAAASYMLLVLQKGLDTVEFTQRLFFMTHNSKLWTIGWILWAAADFSILYFYLSFSDAHRKYNDLVSSFIRYAISIAIAGFALDLIAEIIEMSILPALAHKILSNQANASIINRELFAIINRLAVMITGFLANGLYTLCAALMIFVTWERYSTWIKTIGCIAIIAGIYLSWAAYANMVPAMVGANAALLPALLIWLTGIAYESKAKSWKEKFVIKA